MSGLKTIRIKTSSGITLDCVEQGNRNAPAVLLLHGYSDSRRSYGPLLAALPPSQRAVAVSLRGHGASQKPDTGYGIDDFAGDLPAVLDLLGVADVAIVGHSMGSMVAARLALDAPERVRSLVLIGALATLRGNAAIDASFCKAVDAMSDPVDAGFVRAFQESTLARPVAPAFLDTIVEESCKVPARVWQGALRGMLEADLTPELHRISVPTLLLWGDQDGVCDRKSQADLVRAISSARLSVLEGAGHAPHWEDPRTVAIMIDAFLDAAAPAAA